MKKILEQKGASIILVLQFLTILSILAVGVANSFLNETKIHRNLRLSKESFYSAEAGIEHARTYLRQLNQSSPKINSFSDELDQLSVNKKNNFGWKLPPPENYEKEDFEVFIKEDKSEKSKSIFSEKRKAILTSSGKGKLNNQVTIKAVISLFQQIPSLPGTITILGEEVNYIGNNNFAKTLSGDDFCGKEPSKAVIALSENSSYQRVKQVVEENNSSTYSTKDPRGKVQDINAIGELAVIFREFGVDFKDYRSLTKMIERMSLLADLVIKENTESKKLKLGTKTNPKVIVAEKDFILNSDGAGILIVKGSLGIENTLNYEGIILVVGEGVVIFGKGNQNIKGGLLIANINHRHPGNDGKIDTGDDRLGSALFDTSGADNIFITSCSQAVYALLSKLPIMVTGYSMVGEKETL